MDKQTEIERYVIMVVKQKRLDAGMSQRALSIKLGLEEAYVGHAENPSNNEKYNLNHLNELAKIFKCPISDFFPNPFLDINCIQEYRKLHKRNKD